MTKRIYWHKFAENHPDLFRKVEKMLHNHGFELVLNFDSRNVCHDAYIQKRHPDAAVTASVK